MQSIYSTSEQFYNNQTKIQPTKSFKPLIDMISQQDEDSVILFIHKKTRQNHLKTQNCKVQNQQFVPRWEQNMFYHDVKKKIHQKLKTEPTSQSNSLGLFKNSKISNIHKQKSKITISTFQIAIDPFQRKTQHPFQIERKIYHKVQSNLSIIKAKPAKIIRNLSAKVDKETLLANSSRSFHKKQQIKTCRKNSKVEIFAGKMESQFLQKLASLKQVKQKDFSCFIKGIQQKKFKKSKSEITKETRENLMTKNIDKKPLMFYFQAKNTFKPSIRQTSIKKLRLRQKQIQNEQTVKKILLKDKKN